MSYEMRSKAIALAKQAVAEDNNGNHKVAFELYMDSIKHFEHVIKFEKNPSSKTALTNKLMEYVERAEFLKKNLDDPIKEEQSAATGLKSKPNSDSKEDEEKERMQGALSGAIMQEKPNVQWDDIAGLDSAKEALKEAVILPVKFPHFFTGERKPWSGILLYGPPGTGKSYLAKAVATEADSTFFSVTASDLVSKWMGESEKQVATLFRLARERAPSIVFLDEVDSLCSARGETESEAARRIKTQFLVEMEGVKSSDKNVLVLGATNLPYSLDQAVRRRFQKRVYIPLPEAHARARMFKLHLGTTPHNLTDQQFNELGQITEGFSGADINIVVKDVLMQPIRMLREATHFKEQSGPNGPIYVACPPSDPAGKEMTLEYFAENSMADKVLPPPITYQDFRKSMLKAKPTVSSDDLKVFVDFTNDFGEEG